MDLIDVFLSDVSPAQKELFALQRAAIPGKHRVIEARSVQDAAGLMEAVTLSGNVILRGFHLLQGLGLPRAIRFGRSIIVDHAWGEVPRRSQDRPLLQAVRRVLTYAPDDFNALREMGVTRVTQLPHPFLLNPQIPLPDSPAYGFIPMCSSWRKILTTFVHARNEMVGGVGYPVYTTERGVGVEQVPTTEEVVRRSTILVIPCEDRDLGGHTPVALSYRGTGRHVVTTLRRSLSSLYLPAKEGIHLVPSHALSVYYNTASRIPAPVPGASYADAPSADAQTRNFDAFWRAICENRV